MASEYVESLLGNCSPYHCVPVLDFKVAQNSLEKLGLEPVLDRGNFHSRALRSSVPWSSPSYPEATPPTHQSKRAAGDGKRQEVEPATTKGSWQAKGCKLITTTFFLLSFYHLTFSVVKEKHHDIRSKAE